MITVRDDDLESAHPLPLNFIRAEVEAEIARLERDAQLPSRPEEIAAGSKPVSGPSQFASDRAPLSSAAAVHAPAGSLSLPDLQFAETAPESRPEPRNPPQEPLRADPDSAPVPMMGYGQGGGWGAWLLAVAIALALGAAGWLWLIGRDL